MVYKLIIGEGVYIGSCASIQGFFKRWTSHKNKLVSNTHASPKLQNYFNKYRTLEMYILEVCERGMCIEREQHYIDILKPNLNIRLIAKNNLGLVVSEESKMKLKIANTGKVRSERVKREQSIRLKGIKTGVVVSVETREKLRLSNLGKVLTQEQKDKMRTSNKGVSEITRKALREAIIVKVIRIDFNGETKLYESMVSTKQDGFNPSSVWKCCKGITNTHKNYTWKYAV